MLSLAFRCLCDRRAIGYVSSPPLSDRTSSSTQQILACSRCPGARVRCCARAGDRPKWRRASFYFEPRWQTCDLGEASSRTERAILENVSALGTSIGRKPEIERPLVPALDREYPWSSEILQVPHRSPPKLFHA